MLSSYNLSLVQIETNLINKNFNKQEVVELHRLSKTSSLELEPVKKK